MSGFVSRTPGWRPNRRSLCKTRYCLFLIRTEFCLQHSLDPTSLKKETRKRNMLSDEQIEAVQTILCYLEQLLHGGLMISCKCFSVAVGFCIVCLMAITQRSAAGGMRWFPNNESGFPHHWAPLQFGQRELCCSGYPNGWFIMQEGSVLVVMVRNLNQGATMNL